MASPSLKVSGTDPMRQAQPYHQSVRFIVPGTVPGRSDPLGMNVSRTSLGAPYGVPSVPGNPPARDSEVAHAQPRRASYSDPRGRLGAGPAPQRQTVSPVGGVDRAGIEPGDLSILSSQVPLWMVSIVGWGGSRPTGLCRLLGFPSERHVWELLVRRGLAIDVSPAGTAHRSSARIEGRRRLSA